MNQTKIIKDGAIMLGIFAILSLITFLVPFLNIISLFLLPIPFILFASKYNWKTSISFLVIVILISFLLGTIFSIASPIVMGFGGVMIGYAIYRNLSAYETLARGTFGYIIGMLVLIVSIQGVLQINIVQELKSGFEESMEMSMALFESMGIQEQSAQYQEIMEAEINYLFDLVPVFFILSAFLFALISQWASYKIINRVEKEELYFPKFRTLRIPSSLLWIYLVTIILSLMNLSESGTLYLAVHNAQMLLGLLLALQGFSFIFYYAYHKRLSKIVPILSIVLTVIFPFVFLTLVRLIGIFDIGFNMRERLMNSK